MRAKLIEEYMEGLAVIYDEDTRADDYDVMIRKLDKLWLSMTPDERVVIENESCNFLVNHNLMGDSNEKG